jgi:hypothetical protein
VSEGVSEGVWFRRTLTFFFIRVLDLYVGLLLLLFAALEPALHLDIEAVSERLLNK